MSKMSIQARLIATLGLLGLRPNSDEDSTAEVAEKLHDAVKDVVDRAQAGGPQYLGENGRVPTATELRQIFADTGLEATLPGLYGGKYDGLIGNLQIFRVDDCWRIRFSHEFFSANVGAAQNFLKSWSVAAGNRSYWNRFGSKNTYGAFLEIGVAPMPERG